MSSESFSRQQLASRAARAGAVAFGIAACSPVSPLERRRYLDWLGRGDNAAMDYMARNIDLRFDPDGLLPGCRSIISFAFSYYHPDAPGTSDAIFARYALGDDYHDVLRARLNPVAEWIRETCDAETRICVDTAPLLERYWAERAGVGFRGLNGLLIVPGAGSWVLLAQILTTATLPADSPSRRSCGACRRCIEACPGQALRSDATVDARRCRSYLTIESRDPELPAGVKLGRRIYGCDICQEVCPWNQGVTPTLIPEFTPRPAILQLTRADIAAMTQDQFSLIFRRSAIKRAKLTGLHRNLH